MNNICTKSYLCKTYDELLNVYIKLDMWIHHDIILQYAIKLKTIYNPKGEYYNLIIQFEYKYEQIGLYILNKILEWFGDYFEKIKTT